MINIHLLILKSGSFVQYDCIKPVATQRLPGCLRQEHGVASIKEMGAALGNAEEQWHKAIVLVVGQKRGDTILPAAPALKRTHGMKAESIEMGNLPERRPPALKCPEVACQGPHGWRTAIDVQQRQAGLRYAAPRPEAWRIEMIDMGVCQQYSVHRGERNSEADGISQDARPHVNQQIAINQQGAVASKCRTLFASCCPATRALAERIWEPLCCTGTKKQNIHQADLVPLNSDQLR